jgi:hypothetical protein
MNAVLRVAGSALLLPAVAFFVLLVASDAVAAVVLTVALAIVVAFGVSFLASTTRAGWMSGLAIVVLAYAFAATIAAAWVGSCLDCMHSDIQRRYWIDDVAIGLSILFGTSLASAVAGSVIGCEARRLTSRSSPPSA